MWEMSNGWPGGAINGRRCGELYMVSSATEILVHKV